MVNENDSKADKKFNNFPSPLSVANLQVCLAPFDFLVDGLHVSLLLELEINKCLQLTVSTQLSKVENIPHSSM